MHLRSIHFYNNCLNLESFGHLRISFLPERFTSVQTNIEKQEYNAKINFDEHEGLYKSPRGTSLSHDIKNIKHALKLARFCSTVPLEYAFESHSTFK